MGTLITINLALVVAMLLLTNYALKNGNIALTLEKTLSVFHIVQSVGMFLFAATSFWYSVSFGLGAILGLYVAVAVYGSYDWHGFVEYLSLKGISKPADILDRLVTMGWNPFVGELKNELVSVGNSLSGKVSDPDLGVQGIGNSLNLVRLLVFKKSHLLCSLLATSALIWMIFL